jgi:hypothetical protein
MTKRPNTNGIVKRGADGGPITKSKSLSQTVSYTQLVSEQTTLNKLKTYFDNDSAEKNQAIKMN